MLRPVLDLPNSDYQEGKELLCRNANKINVHIRSETNITYPYNSNNMS